MNPMTTLDTIKKDTAEGATRLLGSSQGLRVRSGLRAGSRVKTSDREQAEAIAWLKS